MSSSNNHVVIGIDKKSRTVDIIGLEPSITVLTLTAQGAFDLCRRLQEDLPQLRELADFYDCAGCGGTHHNSVKVCPLEDVL